MNSRVRSGLEAWAAAQDAKQPAQQKRKWKHHRRFGLRYVDSLSAGLRYKILTYVCLFFLVFVLCLVCCWTRGERGRAYKHTNYLYDADAKTTQNK